jgi:hypothetical protein
LAAKVVLGVVVDPEYPVVVVPVTEMDPVDPVLVTMPEMLTKRVQATRIPLFRPEQILAA